MNDRIDESDSWFTMVVSNEMREVMRSYKESDESNNGFIMVVNKIITGINQ